MKPAIAHRDVKPDNVIHGDGVTVHIRRSRDPERLERLLKLLERALDDYDRREK